VADPVTRGVPPAARNVKGDVASRNALLLKEGAEKAVEAGHIPLKDYIKIRTSIKLYNAVTNKPDSLDKLDNLWIVGPPGTGKSRYVRENYTREELYDKPLNKWWDAYEGEPTVVLDDFGKNHAILGDHLKRWADHYPFTAEVKGGACILRPKSIIVTSNYHPNEIFEDMSMAEAVVRRFNIVTSNELN